MTYVADRLSPPPPVVVQSGRDRAGGQVEAEVPAGEARGARSIAYSIAAYLLSWPALSMGLLAVVQAAIIAAQLALFSRLIELRSRWRFVGAVAVLALASPVAIFANYAMPDVFAATGILAVAMLAIARNRFSSAARWGLMLLLAISATVHASHMPLLGALALFALLGELLRSHREGVRLILALAGVLGAPLLLGALITVTSSWVGFGEASLAAKRFPLTLARSIEDGPARWYLQEECKRPSYAICEVFGTDLPETVPAFLWEPDGITVRATPSQLDRIRAEEQEILLRAAERYPSAQASSMFENSMRQLVQIGFGDNYIDQRIARDRSGDISLQRVPAPGGQAALHLLGWATLLSTALALIALLLFVRRLDHDRRVVLALVVLGLLLNAVICAVFSGVTDRYQARVVWLLPLLALFFLPSSKRGLLGKTLRSRASGQHRTIDQPEAAPATTNGSPDR